MSDYKVTNLKGAPIDYSDKKNWVHLPEKTDKEASRCNGVDIGIKFGGFKEIHIINIMCIKDRTCVYKSTVAVFIFKFRRIADLGINILF